MAKTFVPHRVPGTNANGLTPSQQISALEKAGIGPAAPRPKAAKAPRTRRAPRKPALRMASNTGADNPRNITGPLYGGK